MKFLKKLIIFLVVILVLLAVAGFFLPAETSFQRSITIEAPSETVHGLLADLRKWPTWSWWTTEKDPTLEYEYSGAASGVGAEEKWTAEKLGNGAMRITASDPQKGITYELSFEGSDEWVPATIALAPRGGSTEVTWSFAYDAGKNILVRYIMFFSKGSMEKIFDESLSGLKRVSEGDAGAPPAGDAPPAGAAQG